VTVLSILRDRSLSVRRQFEKLRLGPARGG
jgi:hypothetical protein